MCGLTGFLSKTWFEQEQTDALLTRMLDSIAHRGPDDSGIWSDTTAGIFLGHRRLAVVDISPAGHQPMSSRCGRYVIVFNGEIYNHLALRKKLVQQYKHQQQKQQRQWQGHSDTETLLACFAAWGVQQSLQDVEGMFALAVWDRQKRQLTLARDRMGEKPLYYGWCRDAFLFGSELKALRQYPGFPHTVARDVLSLYLRYSYIPAPYSIYEDIYKIEPGCMLTVDAACLAHKPAHAPTAESSCNGSKGVKGIGWTLQPYWSLWSLWSLQDQIKRSDHLDNFLNEQESLSLLEARLLESVQLQSAADVPLGAFLSGGIDSSLIVALMQRQASQPIKTFTIGFEEQGYSEAVYAKAVAQHLRTDHTELYLSAAQAMAVIPQLPTLYDEPFADSSQIPCFLVAQMARQYVTVALSGDGGDELFGGYNRYFWVPQIWKRVSLLPYPVRQQICRLLIGVSKRGIWKKKIFPLVPVARAGEKMHKLGQRLQGVRNIDDFYLSLLTEWRRPEEILALTATQTATQEPKTLLTRREQWPQLDRIEERMMYLDAMTYLPDDILCKVDRAAMGVGLETRVPFLSHRVVELAWRLPLSVKIRDGQGKWALRQILYKYVPQEFIERPKQGFAIPLGDWLRGPLRDWAEHLLDATRLVEQGYFVSKPIQQKWQEHISGKRHWEHSLWSVLMFQAWLERQKEKI
ncbi:MAG: asparagine synthase (glutamine-hydrolyzing) [Candidatus Electrothrix sp. AW3_4]|nr:asparagine synthase (glutamine-hydrolyzing) [Candidatus Electrothrix gigas]